MKFSTEEIKHFLQEDAPKGDATSLCFPSLQTDVCKFKFIAKSESPFILCGGFIVENVLSAINKSFKIFETKPEGATIYKKDTILEGKALKADFLLIERLCLNIMQHASGIATNTNAFVRRLQDPKIKILDTRKTLPGLRALQKYAVKCGGGINHRFSLSDMIMVKDNHIKAVDGIENALKLAIANNTSKVPIEVECENLEQVEKAVKYKVGFIMLDNMNVKMIRQASSMIRGASDAKIEVSGGVNFENITQYRGLDIDFISVGALTHSVNAIDISAKIV